MTGQVTRVTIAAPFLDLTLKAGIDLLPEWAREMHGLPAPLLATNVARAGTHAMARTLRRAFQDAR